MKFSEFFRSMLSSDSEVSSKRVSGLLLIFVSVILSFIAIFCTDKWMTIDESVLILIAQFLTAGCGLLGLTLKEGKPFDRPVKRDRSGDSIPKYTTNNNKEIGNG